VFDHRLLDTAGPHRRRQLIASVAALTEELRMLGGSLTVAQKEGIRIGHAAAAPTPYPQPAIARPSRGRRRSSLFVDVRRCQLTCCYVSSSTAGIRLARLRDAEVPGSNPGAPTNQLVMLPLDMSRHPW
jgi:hypothetical protein